MNLKSWLNVNFYWATNFCPGVKVFEKMESSEFAKFALTIIRSTNFGLKMNKFLKKYDNPSALYDRLFHRDSGAIQYLHRKTAGFLMHWRGSRNLAPTDLEEINQDAIIITIRKIETGDYHFNGVDPCAYAAGVAKKLVSNFLKKRRMPAVDIQDWDASEDPAIERYLHRKEVQALISEVLNRMPKNCHQLIMLRHFDEKTDEEVLREKLTPYSSIESLRSRRGECMKQLRQLLQSTKGNS